MILNEIARHHRFERPKEIGVFLGRHHADEAAKAQPGREGVGAGKRRTEQNSNDPAALDRSVTALDYDQSGIATTYDEARALIPARRSHWQGLLSAHVDRTAISLVVDLGCGTGRFSEMLAAEFEAWVVGLDPSEKLIDQARRKPAPCRIWARGSRQASARGRPRRSRVYVAGLSPSARSSSSGARMPAPTACWWLCLHPHRDARKRCRRAKLFPGSAGHARRRLAIRG